MGTDGLLALYILSLAPIPAPAPYTEAILRAKEAALLQIGVSQAYRKAAGQVGKKIPKPLIWFGLGYGMYRTKEANVVIPGGGAWHIKGVGPQIEVRFSF